MNADTRQVVLLPVGWETHSSPEMGQPPQAILNKQVLRGCDVLVGVFWTRIGTATAEFESGSVEEIEEHIKTGRPTMLYFSESPVVLDSVDADQYRRLKEFRQSCQSRGLYEAYADLGDFRSKLYRHLQLKVNQSAYFQTSGAAPESSSLRDLPPPVHLSREAQFLLKTCAVDPKGQILYVTHLAGTVLQAGAENLIEENNERSRATWVGALDELERAKLVAATSAMRNVFKITKAGFEAADRLPT